MHRSGTSSVAGALTQLGAASPRTLMSAAQDNPKGFWESQVLMEFHDALLQAGGSNWRDWRAFGLAGVLSEQPQLTANARAHLSDEFGDEPMIVLKDPRVCRFFPFWDQVLEEAGYRVVVVAPLRSPMEVASSLMARNAMNLEEALRLWLRHVLDAERASRGRSRVFLDWAAFLENWRHDAARMRQILHLDLHLEDEGRARAVDDFLSTELRRQAPIEGAAPDWIASAYELMLAAAGRGEDDRMHDQLDELRWEFDKACQLFADAPR